MPLPKNAIPKHMDQEQVQETKDLDGQLPAGSDLNCSYGEVLEISGYACFAPYTATTQSPEPQKMSFLPPYPGEQPVLCVG